MPFDGNGNFELPSPAYPAVAGATITADNWNTVNEDLAGGLSNTLARDGQSAATANLPMGGNKLTGLGASSSNGDSVRHEQLFGSGGAATPAAARANLGVAEGSAGTTAGTNSAYTLTPSNPLLAYAVGTSFFVRFHTACAATPTLNISGLGAVNLVKQLPDGTYANIGVQDIPTDHRSRVTFISATEAWVETLPPGTYDVGDVKFHSIDSLPSGWLVADGTAVSRTTYARLFAKISTTYGTGDGATTFTLPDLRGEFIRGLDKGRGVDTGRAIASAQSSQNLSHSHSVSDPGHTHPLPALNSSGGSYPSSTAGGSSINYPMTGTSGSNDTGISINSSGGTEARPRNLAMLACIKY